MITNICKCDLDVASTKSSITDAHASTNHDHQYAKKPKIVDSNHMVLEGYITNQATTYVAKEKSYKSASSSDKENTCNDCNFYKQENRRLKYQVS